jgi:hypothetical protein
MEKLWENYGKAMDKQMESQFTNAIVMFSRIARIEKDSNGR